MNKVTLSRAGIVIASLIIGVGVDNARAADYIACYAQLGKSITHQCAKNAEQKWDCQHSYIVEGYTKEGKRADCNCPAPGTSFAVTVPDGVNKNFETASECNAVCQNVSPIGRPGLISVVECPAAQVMPEPIADPVTSFDTESVPLADSVETPYRIDW